MIDNIKVFVVEDEYEARGMLVSAFQMVCRDVYGFSNGKDALEEFENIKPDIIFTDVSMPQMNGLELGKAVKSISPSTKIAITTAHSDMSYIQEAFEIGFDNYFTKPILLPKIISFLKEKAEQIAAVKNLKDTKQNYEEIFNSINDGIILHDMNSGRVLEINSTVEKMFGYTKEEFLQLDFLKLSAENSQYSQKKALVEVEKIKELGVDLFEWRVKKKSGEIFWIEASVKKAKVSGKNRAIVIVRDISEKKEREKKLQQYLKIISNSKEMMAFIDSKGRYRAVNSQYLEVLQLEEKDVIGKTTPEFFDVALYNEKIKPYLDKALDGQDVKYSEWFELPIGKKFYQVLYTPFIVDNKVDGVVLNINDLTEYRLAQDKLSLVVESIPYGAWLWDLQTHELYLSPGWKALIGFKDEELPNNEESFFSKIHPDDQSIVDKNMKQHFQHETEYYETVFRLRCKDGSYKWIRARGKALFDDEEKPVLFAGLHEDISEEIELQEREEDYKKKLKNEISEQLEKLREKDQMMLQQSRFAAMGEMLSMIAHQWRQPINAISSSAINLNLSSELETITTEEIEEQTEFIQRQCGKMSETISDFMDFFKPDKTKEDFEAEKVLSNTEKMVLAQLKGRNIELSISQEKNVVLHGVANELEHVILNLISNSRDAMEEKDIQDKKIEIRVKRSGSDTVIEFSDNAGGIPKNVIDKIFDPYFTTKKQGKGTGIGLYMTKTIIEREFSGEISVSNRQNGALFTIKIPMEGNNIEN